MIITKQIQKAKTRLKGSVKLVAWFAAAITLVMIGLREHMHLFVGVDQLSAQPSESIGRTVRLGGIVAERSISLTHNGMEFTVRDLDNQDSQSRIKVRYQGVAPSLFKEGKAMVAEGRLVQGVFVATEILAKHDERYQIPNAGKR